MIWKIAIQNLKRHKIYISIIAVILFLTTLAGVTCLIFKDTAVETKEQQLENYTYNIHFNITPKRSEFLAENVISDIQPIEEIVVVPRLYGNLLYQNSNYSVLGTDVEKQNQIYSIISEDSKRENSNFKNEILVSQDFFSDNDLHIGEKISLDNNASEITIGGVFDNTISILNGIDIVLPIEKLQKYLECGDHLNALSITVKDTKNISNIGLALRKNIGDQCYVDQIYNDTYYANIIDTVNIALNILLVYFVFICIYLCWSLYKGYLLHKQTEIGILASLGMTRNKISIIQHIEYLYIAFPVVILGSISANILTKFLIYIFFEMNINPVWNRAAFLFPLFVIFIGFICYIFSLNSIIKKSTLELIKGKEYDSKKNEKNRIISALISLVIMLGCLYLYQQKKEIEYLIGSAIFFVIFYLFAGILIFEAISRLLLLAFKPFSCRMTFFIKMFINEFESIKNAILLFSFVISICFLASSVSEILLNSTTTVYGKTDIVFNNLEPQTNKIIEDKLNNRDFAKSIVKVDRAKIHMNDQEVILSGIAPDEYQDVAFEKTVYTDNMENIWYTLNDDQNNIIITKNYADSNKINMGDKIIIDLLDKQYTYSVTGIIESFEEMGRVFFVNEKNFVRDFEPMYTSYLISTPNKTEITDCLNKIKKTIGTSTNYNLNSVEQLQVESYENNRIVLDLVNIMILITLIISFIGLMNENIISTMGKLKLYAIRHTLGMSRNRIIGYILFSSILTGVLSGVIGIVVGKIIQNYVSTILNYYVGGLTGATGKFPVLLLIIAVLINLISLIIPINSVKKMNAILLIKGGE